MLAPRVLGDNYMFLLPTEAAGVAHISNAARTSAQASRIVESNRDHIETINKCWKAKTHSATKPAVGEDITWAKIVRTNAAGWVPSRLLTHSTNN
jgi:hypothetical protein